MCVWRALDATEVVDRKRGKFDTRFWGYKTEVVAAVPDRREWVRDAVKECKKEKKKPVERVSAGAGSRRPHIISCLEATQTATPRPIYWLWPAVMCYF